MISEKEFQEMIVKFRDKNKKNPFFKSKMQSMIERREKSSKGEFFFVSEKYKSASQKEKKILVALSKSFFRLISDKRNKRMRAIFISLNEQKRFGGFTMVDIPGQLENELRHE